MKLQLIPVLAAIGLTSLVGCSKELSLETHGGSIIPADTSDFHATVSGAAWEATEVDRSATIANGIITITGTSADGKLITLELNNTQTGAYSLDSSATNSIGIFIDNNSSNTFPYSTNQSSNTGLAGGSVTVTKIDSVNKTISGTFQYNAFRLLDNSVVAVTAGVFTNLPFSFTPPPPDHLDTLHAEIDGTLFTPATVQGYVASGQIVLEGVSSDGSTAVGLLMPLSITPGSYNLDLSGSTAGAYTTLGSVLPSTSGTLVIIENNTTTKHIRGTFQFVASDQSSGTSSNLANGVFGVDY